MVSLWPWRNDNTSPASFERTLSTLSTKISKSQQLLDQLHQRSRKFRALWTLYTSFAYLLYILILALVVGWTNWGLWEYSAIAGSPLFIYLIRTGITTYYTFRIDAVTQRLGEQQNERAKTINKLKDATKYNSTQQLLEKYGGAQAQPIPKRKSPTAGSMRTPQKTQRQPQRTSTGPPATANIPQNQPIDSPSTHQHIPTYMSINRAPIPITKSPVSSLHAGPPEFAPNAFGSVLQYDRSSESNTEGKWYDRILDLLLGEDETSPKNRIVLICKDCRLVNGQAPPGVKRIEELGNWRCIGCGGWNSKTDEGAEIIEKVKQRAEIETKEQPDASRSAEDSAEGLAKDSVNLDEEALEEEEYEEVYEEVDAEEEATQETGRGQPNDTDHTES